MIVVGLDGATWSVIKPNLGHLPALGQLLQRYRHSTLVCDVRPVHSAASWTTIFSGQTPEQHGIRHFVMEEAGRKALLARKMFIWDRVPRAIAMCIPIAIPPLNHNYELRDWQWVMLATAEEEMYRSTEKLVADAIAAMEYGDAGLIAVVFSETDRAQHMLWHKPELVLKHYQNIDRALAKLMPYLEKDDFLILSDHGFTDAEETRRNGWDTVRDNQTGGHHPDGIAISNIANMAPPGRVTGVYDFITAALGKGKRAKGGR